MVKIQQKYGKNMVKYSQFMAKIWQKYGKNMVKIQSPIYCKNMDKRWVKLWSKHDLILI